MGHNLQSQIDDLAVHKCHLKGPGPSFNTEYSGVWVLQNKMVVAYISDKAMHSNEVMQVIY